MENLPHDFFLKSYQFTRQNRIEPYATIEPTNPANSLAGRVAIITGASRGLGALGLAPVFAKAGPKGLILVATNAEKLKATEQSVNAAYPDVQTLAVTTDISSPASVEALFKEVNAKFGYADVLVHNASTLSGGGADIHEEDPATFWKNFEVNSLGAYTIFHSFIAALPDPKSTKASIVALTTGGAWGVYPSMTGYAISKLAALQLTSYVGAIYENITAISLHPGLMETDMIRDEFRRFHIDKPEYVASVALWMASEQAKFMSGRVMTVNWDIDELVARKDEIVGKDLLKIGIGATLGSQQFE